MLQLHILVPIGKTEKMGRGVTGRGDTRVGDSKSLLAGEAGPVLSLQMEELLLEMLSGVTAKNFEGCLI